MPLEGLQNGRYRRLRLLGGGGMGEVYLMDDTRIGRQVAIKVIRTEATAYPNSDSARDAVRLFQREARAIAALEHPNILPLHDFGEENLNGSTLTYMVMTYCPEGSFADWLRYHHSSSLLSPQDVVYFINQAAEALQYAHDHQVIHLDVKPANFLIRSNPRNPGRPNLLLADFGVAKLSAATTSSSLTVRGTPASMAPEQWSSTPVPATDQYALAVMAYELLVGRPPFLGGLEQMMYQHFHAQPQPPSTLDSRLSHAIDGVLLRALAKKPEGRYPSVSAFAGALEQAVNTLPTASATRPSPFGANDIRATLAISKEEALNGTSRVLTIPGGRRISVSVPAGAYDGQVIRLQDLGGPPNNDTPVGALILTLAIQHVEDVVRAPTVESAEKTVRASNPNLQRPPDPGSNPHLPPVLPSNPNLVPPPAYASGPNFIPPMVQASNPNLPQTIPSTFSTPNQGFPALVPGSSGNIASRSPLTKRNVILLIVLALLLIASAIGIFSFASANQIANSNANATATANTDATNQANATATNQANATATVQANATATAQVRANATTSVIAANPNPYASGGGTLAFYDPLSNNNNGNRWDDGTKNCFFTDGAYHVSEPDTSQFVYCSAKSTDFSNFAYEVQMKIIQGDFGGIIFRGDSTSNKYYLFVMSQYGYYDLLLCPGSSCRSLVQNTFSSFINTGLQQTNLIAVVANGSTITLYVNNHQLTSLNDGTYSHGQIGLVADPLAKSGHPTEVTYNNAKVWTF